MGQYERLSAQDTTFLYLEGPGSPMHVASVALFESEPFFDEVGEFRLDALRGRLLSRLHLVPRFRQKLKTIPFGLGRPIWVDDPHFDITYHVRLTALPTPGNKEQLKTLVSRVVSQPLDRSRPLWEIWFVQGVQGDRVALIEKTHHCLVDGVASIDRWTALLDTRRDRALENPAPWSPRGAPSTVRLLVETAVEHATEPAEAIRTLATWSLRPRQAIDRIAELTQGLSTFIGRDLFTPASSLNRALGLHRNVEWARVSLDKVKEAKRSYGATVNDVVLAAVTGGLHELLRSRGENVDRLTLKAMVPVSVRDASQPMQLGNQVSTMLVALPVGEVDPVVRLRKIQATVSDLKKRKQAIGAEFLIGLSEHAVPTLFGLAARQAHRLRSFNLLVTNVPGPRTPLYCLGAELKEWYTFAPLGVMQDISVVILSYCGEVNIGLNGDRDAFPDVTVFVEAIEKAFVELENAADTIG